MLLTITTTHQPATDLGYLLHKNPDRPQSFELSFGQAHVFYPEVTDERCTAALLLEIDPITLIRTNGGGTSITHYINDRPFVASSFLSVAIAQVYGTALAGKSRERPELAATPLPLVAQLAAVPSRRGGESMIRALFEPLGYTVTTTGQPLDEQFPAWGPSPYYRVELAGTVRLQDLLTHLYVLMPVLDDAKHYEVSEDEAAKLLRHGEGWLSTHPARAIITDRYLRHRTRLVHRTMAQLAEDDVDDEEEPTAEVAAPDQPAKPAMPNLHLGEQRLRAVVAALLAAQPQRVLDLGCGEGVLVRALLAEPSIAGITGV
ncbi:MAG: 3' terminal RNA ribose 2'-O-methyltransferase Hen1, partial [Chloroflexi bacterium]|nr:3' terminal RNA ribose 2'-O-methyltransferase Hen1 [Chloroflexota bacterium]